ncbi:MAG: sodium:proton antiporter [Algisphaera sp.]
MLPTFFDTTFAVLASGDDHSATLMWGIVAVVGLGVSAQWLAWRLKLPAILMLLLAGFGAGPMSGLFLEHGPWLSPDRLLGDLLFPVVSLSVAIVLFEGGLTLKSLEWKTVGRAVIQLCSIGVLITWCVCGVAAHYVLGLDWGIALLLGAMLTVTGPTVVGPLLRQVKPVGSTATTLKWEGILIDPVGALLAVLVFEGLMVSVGHGSESLPTREIALETTRAMGGALAAGILCGMMAAGLLVLLMKRYWLPDYLQNPVTLALVGVAFAASNYFQEESGLLAVTVMGVAMANQRMTPVRHIIDFKENLTVLLIASLFILLSSRVDIEVIKQIGWPHLAFLLIVMFVARPVSVMISTIGCGLKFKQRLLISLIAPRGIVAAAIASVFALRLTDAGYAGADQLVPAVFLVIVGTIAFAGLLAKPIARALGQTAGDADGVLFVGAHAWAREIAGVLHREGFAVHLIDTNRDNVQAARMAGMPATNGSLLSEHVEGRLELAGLTKLIALTANDEANALAAVHMIESFGRKEVYQVAPHGHDQRMAKDQMQDDVHPLTGRFFVDNQLTYGRIAELFAAGAELKATKLTEAFDWNAYIKRQGDRATPLFLLLPGHRLQVLTAAETPQPAAGQTVVALVRPEASDGVTAELPAAASLEAATGQRVPHPKADPVKPLDPARLPGSGAAKRDNEDKK